MAKLETRGLSVGYHGKPLMKEIQLSVLPGKILALIGPNGSGKTTILKTIIGSLEPMGGVVLLDGNDLNRLKRGERAKEMAAMMTGRTEVEHATCFEVVSVGRHQFTGISGRLSEADEKAVQEALEFVGAEGLSGAEFSKLSDGQKQRVLLARALAQEPEILILDEPTSFLDIGYKLAFADKLKRLAREKQIGVVLSLHEIELAKRIADECLCITREGKIDRMGKVEEILTPAYVEQLFNIEEGEFARTYENPAPSHYNQGHHDPVRSETEHVAPGDIETRSFEIIGEELSARNIVLPEDKAFLIKRAIHTTADFEYAKTLCFSGNAIGRMAELIRSGADIVTDTNMALSGINKKELAKYGGEVHCFMADEDVATEAKTRGVTRATVSMERAAKWKKPVIFAIGNAPTALLNLRAMYDNGTFRPEFIVGVPVGFVNVEISKERIMETDIPYIINRGRKGGSNVAAAICNAVLYEMKKGNL
ncbi:MAG: precorrin-8X methylmutase [Acetatifactor sp.]|nr:precorrin-8X methylmutase [Acetatifactor sp.]